jgi:Holliday junction resolvase RusA-like endonuclease
MKIKELRLKLPIPPSLNKLYSNIYIQWRERRSKSKYYKDWIEVSSAFLNTQDNFIIKGDKWLRVRYEFYIPLYYKNKKKKKIDVFNFEKALSDFLADHIPGFKDEYIKEWFIRKFDSNENMVYIYISEI